MYTQMCDDDFGLRADGQRSLIHVATNVSRVRRGAGGDHSRLSTRKTVRRAYRFSHIVNVCETTKTSEIEHVLHKQLKSTIAFKRT